MGFYLDVLYTVSILMVLMRYALSDHSALVATSKEAMVRKGMKLETVGPIYIFNTTLTIVVAFVPVFNTVLAINSTYKYLSKGK